MAWQGVSHTASLWHEISSQEKKLGEQMIPIIRKPTVLITIPRTTEPPTRVLAQPPSPALPEQGPAPAHSSHPSSQPLPLPGTLPWHGRSKGDASPAAHFMPHSISRGLSLLPSLLLFLFPPPCLFFVWIGGDHFAAAAAHGERLMLPTL